MDYKPLGSMELIENALVHPTDSIFFVIAEALANGFSVDEIHRLTWIDKWFLSRMKNIADADSDLVRIARQKLEPNRDFLTNLKKLGFSDAWIAKRLSLPESRIRDIRALYSLRPFVKQVDSLAAEWPAKTKLFPTKLGAAAKTALNSRVWKTE